MREGNPPDWVHACRSEGIDPSEVRLVLERYQAYRAYYLKGRRGEPLPIETWFNWYRMEAASEAGQQAPAASGCSVDGDARNRGAIRKPAAFLQALKDLAVDDGSGSA